LQELFSKDRSFIQWLKHQWNIEFGCVREDIDIQGSPERTLSRVVIQDKNNTLFLLEQFCQGKSALRNNIALAVEFLNNNGLDQHRA